MRSCPSFSVCSRCAATTLRDDVRAEPGDDQDVDVLVLQQGEAGGDVGDVMLVPSVPPGRRCR